MFNSDDKIVSISFDNRQFLDDISTTIQALQRLNDATSGKNLSTSGLDNISSAFTTLNRNATTNINAINSAVSDGSAYSTLTTNVQSTYESFNYLEKFVNGVMNRIGGYVVDAALKIPKAFTRGVTDGWSEYNLLMDSTQTILANTQKYGTTMDDVTDALDELNEYADRTIYNFSQMTRNIGYFTTAGQNLEDSVMAIKGLSNVGAFFGANNENVARATYQMSQAMAAGVIKKMDWKSMESASMAGVALQEELIKTAAVMSGMSVDAFRDYAIGSKSFRDSLETNWLTAEVFLETLRKFSGESREYWESLTNADGSRLYTDEQIDEIMKLGETANNAATEVRTFRMMIDALKESIGSGWAESFRILIGDLEEAKKFWTPVNNLLTGMVSGIGNFRNEMLQSWANVFRESAIEDLIYFLEGIQEVLDAIGVGLVRAFGNSHHIANQIGQITEPLGDFLHTLRLSEEELSDLSDFVAGILSPITLILDVIREVTRAIFNASDSMAGLYEGGDSLIDGLKPLREQIFDILGLIGRVLQAGSNFIKENDWVKKSIKTLGIGIREVSNIIDNVLYKSFMLIYNMWNKYNMTERLIQFRDIALDVLVSLSYALEDIKFVAKECFDSLSFRLSQIDFTPVQDIKDIIDGIKNLFLDLLDPTISAAEALNTFRDSVANTTIAQGLGIIIDEIRTFFNILPRFEYVGPIIQGIATPFYAIYNIASKVFSFISPNITKLFNQLKKAKFSEYVIAIRNAIKNLYNTVRNTQIGGVIFTLIDNIKESISSLIDIFRDTELGSTIFGFIDRFKSLLEEKIGLKKPNIFTSLNDISNEVTTTASRVTNFEPINSKLNSVKNVVSNAKEVLAELVPTRDSKNASRMNNVIKDVIDAFSPISDKGDLLENGLNGVKKTIDAVASIDAEGAADKTAKIATVVAGFVTIFKYLSTTIITFMAVLALLNFSKWTKALSPMMKTAATILTDGAGKLSLAIQTAAQSLSDAISTWGNAFREHAKAAKFEAVASIFKTIALLLGVIFAGIILVSQFGKPDQFLFTLREFTINFTALMVGIGAMIMLILIGMGVLTSKTAKLSVSTPKVLLALSVFTMMMSGLILSMTIAVGSLIAMAAYASSVADPDTIGQIYDRISIIMFTIMGTMTVITMLMALMAKNTDILDISGIFKKNKYISTISLMSTMLMSLSLSISTLLLSLSLATAIMTKSGKDSYSSFTKALDFLSGLFKGLAALMVLLSVISLFDTIPAGLIAMTKVILALSVGLLAFGAALSGIILSISFASSVMMTAYTALVELLSYAKVTPAALDAINNILDLFIVSLGSVIIALTVVSAMMVVGGTNSLSAAVGIMAFGAAIYLLGQGVLFIATAFSEIASIISLLNPKRTSDFIAVLNKLESIILWTIGMLGTISIASMIFKGMSRRILLVAAAFSIITLSLQSIVVAVVTLAKAMDSLNDVETAINKLMAFTGLISAIMLVFSILGAIKSTQVGVIIGAASILAIAGAMNVIAGALALVATAIDRYANAAARLEKVNGSKAAENILEIVDTIPRTLKVVSQNIPVVADIIGDIFLALGNGIVQGFFGAWNFAAQTITANIAGVIETLGSILNGILLGVLLQFKDFVAQSGPILVDILMLLGPYLEWGSAYLGYWGFKMMAALLKGIVDAIYDLGWGDWIQRGLNTIITGVQLWFNELSSTIAFGIQQIDNMIRDVDMSHNIMRVETQMEPLEEAIAYMDANNVDEYNDGLVTHTRDWYEDQLSDLRAQRQGYINAQQGLYEETMEDEQIFTGLVQDDAENLLTLYDEINNQIANAHDNQYENAPTFSVTPNNNAVYDPSEYYATLANHGDWNNEFSNAYETTSTWLDAFNGLIPEGGIFGALFGNGDSSFMDSMGDMFNFDDTFASMGDRLGGIFGSNAGESLMDTMSETMAYSSPFTTDVGDTESGLLTIGAQDYSNLEDLQYIDYVNNLDPEQIDKVNDAIGKTANLPDEMRNPVITPILDDTQFWKDYGNFESTWNKKTYDEFAIDANSSMLVREKTSGDAATDGNVTYNFTQYNNSPKELSPIQVYRDTKNLIRGSGNFTLS